ncbi:MAG: hypothetical protein MK188_02710 [Gammaproteobacteria bacterium]|nr:hypothetical protein [Gammaproteobacteria bacterium]
MNKQVLVISLFCLLALVAVSAFVFLSSDKAGTSEDFSNTPQQAATSSLVQPKTDVLVDTDRSKGKTRTFSESWRWRDSPDSAEGDAISPQASSLPFTEQSVHDALQQVKIDENGDVIMDHEALVSLDEALERIYNRLDAESMLQLEDLIKGALPGKTGIQTAELVRNYQQFLQAKEQFYQVNSSEPQATQTVKSIESDQLLYAELQALREIHLGADAVASLFYESDVNAEYMFESIKLGLQSGLSDEEISARRIEIENRRREQLGEPAPEEVDI